MEDCKFKKTETKHGCEGGHTTAQHYMSVNERIIKQECGLQAHAAIEAAVNLAAKYDGLLLSFAGAIMAQTGCDRETALTRVAVLVTLTEEHLKKGSTR